MAKQWQCAVIGTSTVGHTHVKVLSQLENAKLVAVCDLNPEKAKAALERHGVTGVPIYKDQLEMHAKHQLDCVNIATPSGVHMQSALIAFEHNCNVVVEKPLEIRIDRIDRMIDSAKKHNVRLAYISQNRWQEANRALKQAADENRFGRVAYAACYTPWYRPDEYYAMGGWRGTWAFDGGGAIMNQSVHAIDLLQWIAGPVKRRRQRRGPAGVQVPRRKAGRQGIDRPRECQRRRPDPRRGCRRRHRLGSARPQYLGYSGCLG